MGKWFLAMMFLPAWLWAEDSFPKKEFSSAAWQIAANKIFSDNFSYDKSIEGNIEVHFLDWPKIVAESMPIHLNGQAVGVIFFSRGFANLLASEDELLFFLAHEIGHFKMDALGTHCVLCSGSCEELAADRFAIDFMDAKGRDACGGKTLLLKMILKGDADADPKRMEQLRENCRSSIAAP